MQSITSKIDKYHIFDIILACVITDNTILFFITVAKQFRALLSYSSLSYYLLRPFLRYETLLNRSNIECSIVIGPVLKSGKLTLTQSKTFVQIKTARSFLLKKKVFSTHRALHEFKMYSLFDNLDFLFFFLKSNRLIFKKTRQSSHHF